MEVVNPVDNPVAVVSPVGNPAVDHRVAVNLVAVACLEALDQRAAGALVGEVPVAVALEAAPVVGCLVAVDPQGKQRAEAAALVGPAATAQEVVPHPCPAAALLASQVATTAAAFPAVAALPRVKLVSPLMLRVKAMVAQVPMKAGIPATSCLVAAVRHQAMVMKKRPAAVCPGAKQAVAEALTIRWMKPWRTWMARSWLNETSYASEPISKPERAHCQPEAELVAAVAAQRVTQRQADCLVAKALRKPAVAVAGRRIATRHPDPAVGRKFPQTSRMPKMTISSQGSCARQPWPRPTQC